MTPTLTQTLTLTVNPTLTLTLTLTLIPIFILSPTPTLTSSAEGPSVGVILNEVFEAVVEGTLVQPTFVTDHPLEISPLAKPHRSKPGCVERWELFIAGALWFGPWR